MRAPNINTIRTYDTHHIVHDHKQNPSIITTPQQVIAFGNCTYKNSQNVTILAAFCGDQQSYIHHEYQSLAKIESIISDSYHSIYWKCSSFITHLRQKLLHFKDNKTINNKAIECLNDEYVYEGYEMKINKLSSMSTQVDYDMLLFHLRHKRSLQILLRDLFTVFYEYGVILHLFGASALSWYRNCDPITWHDHDIDVAIFQHHFNEYLIQQILNDERLSIYEYSVDFEHERTPLLQNKLRLQFHISSQKVYRLYGITCIDIFVINPTYFAYFTQNEWYHANFFWWFSSYDLEQITVYEGEKDIEFDAFMIANKDIESFLRESFGDSWRLLPWFMREEQIDESDLGADHNRVVGIRAPLDLPQNSVYNHELRLSTDDILKFCVLQNDNSMMESSGINTDRYYSLYDRWVLSYWNT